MSEQPEAELTKMLRDLPVAVTITKRGDSRYIWQAYERAGEAETFTDATRDALLACQCETDEKVRRTIVRR